MSNEWSFILTALIILDGIAILLIANEDILFETEDKFWKIIFVLFIPFFGAIIQLNFLSRGIEPQKKSKRCNDDSKTYELFNHDSSPTSDGDSSGEED